jgi:hypothetical protein
LSNGAVASSSSCSSDNGRIVETLVDLDVLFDIGFRGFDRAPGALRLGVGVLERDEFGLLRLRRRRFIGRSNGSALHSRHLVGPRVRRPANPERPPMKRAGRPEKRGTALESILAPIRS